MKCKRAEADPEERSDVQLPNNSPSGNTLVPTVEKLRKRFLDEIDTVKNTAYIVDDESTMSAALKQLENIQLMLQKSCSSTNGIPLRISPVKKKLKITSTIYHQVFHKHLPPRRRWKKKTLKADVILVGDSKDDVDDGDAKRKATNVFVVDLTASGNDGQKTLSQDDKANASSPDLETLRNGSAEPPVKQLKGEPTKRLLRASKMGLKMTDIMFHAGPAKLTVSDAWTLIHPEVAKRNKNFNSAIPAFEPGWLVDKVIEAVLWRMTLVYSDIFVADTTMAEMVLDRQQKTRHYFDPMNGRVHTILSCNSVPKSKLMELIDDISAVADLKTGWNCKSWPRVEPLHYTQTDSYNCGVIVCLFARCLCEGLDVNGSYNVQMERERITSVIFGSCYDDLNERNTAVCKICKDDDGEDWVR